MRDWKPVYKCIEASKNKLDISQPVNENTECAYDAYFYENPDEPETRFNKPECGFGEHGYYYCPALKGDEKYQAYIKAAKDLYSHDLNCHIESKLARCPDIVKLSKKNDFIKLRAQAEYLNFGTFIRLVLVEV